jgi:NDP-sugar pyrophosphorylase family protein
MRGIVLPFTAFILAGGLGTRLQPVVSDRPKPMAPVQGVPFLEMLLDSLAGKGVRDFVILSGYRGDAIEDYFRNRKPQRTRIRFSREKTPLGTGGAVKHAERFATDPTLLVNGDTFYDADLQELLRFHRQTDAEVTLSLMPVADATRYGSVRVDEHGKVMGFHEKEQGTAGPGLINAGCSLLSQEFIKKLPQGCSFSMEQEIFPQTAQSGSMFGLCRERVFFDIGTPESYEAFQRFATKSPERRHETT